MSQDFNELVCPDPTFPSSPLLLVYEIKQRLLFLRARGGPHFEFGPEFRPLIDTAYETISRLEKIVFHA